MRSDYEFEQKLKQLEYDEKYKKRFVNSLVDVPAMHIFEPRLVFNTKGNARDKDADKTEVSLSPLRRALWCSAIAPILHNSSLLHRLNSRSLKTEARSKDD